MKLTVIQYQWIKYEYPVDEMGSSNNKINGIIQNIWEQMSFFKYCFLIPKPADELKNAEDFTVF